MSEAPEVESAFPYLIEDNKPFSQSLLWQLQRQFYSIHGINAWSEGRIPYGITTNPYIGHAYAQVIVGYLRDTLSQLDLSEPVYIMEIGAGSGRLGFHILRQLEKILPQSDLKHVNYQYILTDLVDKNIDFWQTQPKLKAFADAGKLDFARFDLVNDTEITLKRSGKVLTAGTLKNPLIVVGNYILDSLPMDLFYVEDDTLYEVQVAVMGEEAHPDVSDPDLINHIELIYDRFPTDTNFYQEPELQALLALYQQEFDQIMITFPYHALQCVQGLLGFANNRMMFISADKGEHRLNELFDANEPAIALHDTGFSMQFNYHAIVKLFENRGGTVLTTQMRHTFINILAFVVGTPELPKMHEAYNTFIERFNPDSNYILLREFHVNPHATLFSVLGNLRLSSYDTDIFVDNYSLLMKKITTLTVGFRATLIGMIQELWANYYHIGEKNNLAFYLGVVSQTIRDYDTAIDFYKIALELYGDSARIRYLIGVCHAELGQRHIALEILERVSKEVPEAEDIKALVAKLSAQASEAE